MPRDSEAEIQARTQAMQAAARRASEAPLRCLEACFDLVGAAEALAGRATRTRQAMSTSPRSSARPRGSGGKRPDQLAIDRRPGVRGATTTRVTELLAAMEDLASRAHEVVALASGAIRSSCRQA